MKCTLLLLTLLLPLSLVAQTNVQKVQGTNVISNGSIVVGNSTSLSATGTGSITATAFSGTLPIANGGTAASTASAARANILPSYTGQAGNLLAVNGTATDTVWVTPSSTSGSTGYWGSFYDTTNQSAANTTTAYTVNIGANSGASGVSIASGNRITFAYTGTYNLQYSLQFVNTDTGSSNDNVDIWIRINGTDVPYSNSIFNIPLSKGGNNGALIAVTPYILNVNAGDYVQIMWAVNTTAISIATFAAQTSPTIPITPGVIVGVTQVANILTNGTVTNFTSGSLSPLFSTSVATSTTTPALTFSLSNAAANTILGNNTSSTGAPAYNTVSSFLDNAFGSSQGSVMYRGASGWTALSPGTSGQLLTTGGASANPSWTTFTGSSSVTTLGTITSGVWNGTAIPVAYGGTGSTTAAASQRALTPSTTTISASNVDWSASNSFYKALSANTTLTFSNAQDGQVITVTLLNTSSNYTVTWPTITWAGGTAPTMVTGANYEVFTIYYNATAGAYFGSYVSPVASSGGSGTVTSIDVSGGSTGLTTSGGPITTSGTITLAGTLAVGFGGTGATTKPVANQNLTPVTSTVTSGASPAINWALSNSFDLTLTSATAATISFSNAVDGQTISITIHQPASGTPTTVTWPSSSTLKWTGGTAPTMTATLSKTDVYTIYYNATAGVYYGSYVQNF